MDPLSATGTLIAVLQISSALISICYEYRQGTKNSSRDIVLISDELNSLKDVLEALLKLVENSNHETTARLSTFELLVKEDGPLVACKTELERLQRELEPEKGWRKVRARLIWPLKEGEVRKALGGLERLKGTMQLALSADQAVLSLGLRDDVGDLTEMFQQQSVNQTLQDIYKWLGAPDPYGNHFTNRKKSQMGTGTWLLNSKPYENWILSPKSFLWLYGIPGSGKTVLCSTAIEQLIHYCKQVPKAALVFFYFDFNDTTKRDFSTLIRSLITQLLSQCETIPEVVLNLYQSHMKTSNGIDDEVLLQTFRNLVRTFHDVRIVLDALDESSECAEILRFIENVQDWSLSQVHVLVTSRQLSAIETSFENFISDKVCLQESQMNKDILIYIDDKLINDSLIAKWPADVRQEARSKLLAGAEGMFQWVVCQLDMLRRCLSISALRKALAVPLPKSLDETYEKIISNIDVAYQDEVKRTLQALTVSLGDLTLEKVVEILAIDLDASPPRFEPDARLLDSRSILTMCSSLVTSFKPRVLTNKPNAPLALRLAHASVADYLTQGGVTGGFHFSKTAARQLMAQLCLAYLLHPEFAKGHNRSFSRHRIMNYPFLGHAARYWPLYLDRDGEESATEIDHKTKMLIKELFNTKILPNGGNYACWVGQLVPAASDKVIQNTPPLYYAASFGLVEVIRFLLDFEPNIEIDAVGGRASSSPLQVSVYRDHIDVARILLERGADPDLPNDYQETAVHWAGISKNKEMKQLFYDYGASFLRIK